MENAISVQNCSKKFGQKEVLKSISFHVKSGQIIGLLGPSGCGKTTLIKLLMGMYKATNGTVTVFEQPVPNNDLLQQTGYMAQSDALYTDLTAKENLQFFATLFKIPRKEILQRIDYVASIVDLTDDLQTPVHQFSGGMKRRLSLAIALIQNPKLLILDEPTVGIDPVLKKQVWQELHRLKNEEQKTIFMTTHIMDEVTKCDEVLLLRNGHLIAHNTPQALLEEYNVENFDEIFLRIGGEVK